MMSHTSWEVCTMLETLKPSDFTPVEMMAMAVILAGVNARALSTPPTLRLCPEFREGIRQDIA
jgi:hypothetical protein